MYNKTIPEKIYLETIYGNIFISEPMLIELIQSKPMQRLKKIHQYGITNYIKKTQPYSRYDHSIGVFVLLRSFNASPPEQIAGLLHDVSHTAFSHVSDFIFDYTDKKNSYQDSIHKWFLQQTEINEILKKFDINLEDILHKNKQFTALEQDLPALCADRLEYTLFGGYLAQLLTHKDITFILAHLSIHQGIYVFTNKSAAQKLAYTSLQLTKNHFTTHWNLITYLWAAQMLKHALKINIITLDDIHFSNDDHLWTLLKKSQNDTIQNYMHKLLHYQDFYTLDTNEYTLHLIGKFRGIDPCIKLNGTVYNLSSIDRVFYNNFNTAQKITNNGHYIKVFDYPKKR